MLQQIMDLEGAVVVPEFGGLHSEEQHAELQLLLAENWGCTDTKELYCPENMSNIPCQINVFFK